MGGCCSGPVQLIDTVDGNEDDYQRRYLEDKILGEGEFGIVKMVYDTSLMKQHMLLMSNSNGDNGPSPEEPKPLACKVLRKGVVFKDNVLYTPLKPEVLKGEIDMLRTLAGEYYCLKLCAVYESPKRLFVVTEYCSGGVMTQYVAALGSTFTSDDVSRIAYQLLSAINHCSKYRIIHRDIKPDNVMFTHAQPGADIRLIDFGSGCMDAKQSDVACVHGTFAGSAFYISPEVFRRSYTGMTDVWSVGVTIYVLVAGYPADKLQAAFNLLQCEERNLRKLPNLPDNLPGSFYDLLDGCLTYRYQKRPPASKLLQYDFLSLHQKHEYDDTSDLQEVTSETNSVSLISSHDNLKGNNVDSSIPSMRRNNSVNLFETVARHNLFLDFQKYERSLTTLLATLLSKSDLEQLIRKLETQVKLDDTPFLVGQSANETVNINEQQLAVVPVSDLKVILHDDLRNADMYVVHTV
jgi:calcium/calmodulin-dependent protein kinase I